jgi:ribosomal protein L35
MVSKEGKSSSSVGQRFSATEHGDFARIIQMLEHCWNARRKPRGNYLRNRETVDGNFGNALQTADGSSKQGPSKSLGLPSFPQESGRSSVRVQKLSWPTCNRLDLWT